MRSAHDDMTVKHWQTRPEAGWQDFEYNQPYEKGLRRLQQDVLGKTNYDPTTLFQWGTMQAMAIIEILKDAERVFGARGQKLVLDSLHKIGLDIGRQITRGTTIPDTMTDAEWNSYYATVINRVAYASLESPEIVDGGHIDFHIDWCPHQDHYEAFDCRVQRYFVQGMIDAGIEHGRANGREMVWDVDVESTIPAGSPTCHFDLHEGDPDGPRSWEEFTRAVEAKALHIVDITHLGPRQ